jgi:hypothetical protein
MNTFEIETSLNEPTFIQKTQTIKLETLPINRKYSTDIGYLRNRRPMDG